MTSYTQATLAMADRHIAQGNRLIVEQERRLASLRLKDLPSTKAEKLLALFNETQVEHLHHRDAIAAALEEAPLT